MTTQQRRAHLKTARSIARTLGVHPTTIMRLMQRAEAQAAEE